MSWLMDRDNDADRGRAYEVEVAETDTRLRPMAELVGLLDRSGVRYIVNVAAERGRGSATARLS